MKYSGIDLHSNNCVVVVSDESDRILVSRRVPNSLASVLQALEPHREDIVGVVVEATYNWYWLVDGLQAAGYRVHLANPAAIKRYEGLKRTGDEADAAYLAHLLRLGLLAQSYICPKPLRAVRDLSRKRMQLVRSCTQHILAVESIQARESGWRMNVKQVKQLDAHSVEAMPQLLPEVKLALQANVAVIAELGKQIDKLERCLHQRVRLSEQFRLLKSAPGIGETLATTIMLETGSVARFAQVGNFSSYCRCVDSERVSNGKKKGAGNVKNGNAYLAWAFIEAANFARRYCPEAKRFYERKKARTNNIVATKALAHKLARACYHMLREQKPFEVKRCFG
jgi:Transposase and inactivated derivatives